MNTNTNHLNTGIDLLDQWSNTATQAARNTVYRALFAITDGSVFTTFHTVANPERPSELVICLRDDLVLTISHTEHGTFDIVYIGLPESAPSLCLGLD
jgi:Mg2+ and Co2+ transporter CorA